MELKIVETRTRTGIMSRLGEQGGGVGGGGDGGDGGGGVMKH